MEPFWQSPVLCPRLCGCAGFHWRPSYRVCGGLHLACSSGQCCLWRPIPAGHCGSTALHCPASGGDCTQGGCPVCLTRCHWKGKSDNGHGIMPCGVRMSKICKCDSGNKFTSLFYEEQGHKIKCRACETRLKHQFSYYKLSLRHGG